MDITYKSERVRKAAIKWSMNFNWDFERLLELHLCSKYQVLQDPLSFSTAVYIEKIKLVYSDIRVYAHSVAWEGRKLFVMRKDGAMYG